jgi:ADP-ribosylglycohydrolase
VPELKSLLTDILICFAAHIYMKIVPVTCLYAGKPELQEKVVEAIKVHQNNPKAYAFGLAAARILESVLLGAPLKQALETFLENFSFESQAQKEQVITAFQRGKSTSKDVATLDEVLLAWSHELMKDTPESPFYNFAGRSCGLPGAFIGPVYLLYKAADGKGAVTYASALRENILASGDTCSRAVFTGAVLAASAPDSAPPDSWVQKVDPGVLAKIDAAANAIAELAVGGTSK